MPFKKRIRTFVIFLANAAIGVIIAQVFSFNVLMGVSTIIVLFVGVLVYLVWGTPIHFRRIDWAQRQPKPRTQIELREDKK